MDSIKTDHAGDFPKISSVERNIVAASAVFVAAVIALIAYANWGMGIHVMAHSHDNNVFSHGKIVRGEGKNYDVYFLAKMWGFEPSRVTVPVGSTLDIHVTSKDVTHGFQILNTNVNLMVVPSVVSTAQVHFDKPGVYSVLCHEFCGKAHQNMNAIIEVSAMANDISAEGIESPDAGRKVADDKGCLACHSTDGTVGVGPSFKGIWGKKVELTDGRVLTVDEAFLREMVTHPDKNAVKGFDPVMPELALTDEEFQQITDYLKELK